VAFLTLVFAASCVQAVPDAVTVSGKVLRYQYVTVSTDSVVLDPPLELGAEDLLVGDADLYVSTNSTEDVVLSADTKQLTLRRGGTSTTQTMICKVTLSGKKISGSTGKYTNNTSAGTVTFSNASGIACYNAGVHFSVGQGTGTWTTAPAVGDYTGVVTFTVAPGSSL